MRTEYDSLTPEDRAQFREWVARVAEIEDPMIPLAKSRIYLIPREMHDNPSVQISPKSLLRAIDAWDKGEEYLPSAIGDL